MAVMVATALDGGAMLLTADCQTLAWHERLERLDARL